MTLRGLSSLIQMASYRFFPCTVFLRAVASLVSGNDGSLNVSMNGVGL